MSKHLTKAFTKGCSTRPRLCSTFSYFPSRISPVALEMKRSWSFFDSYFELSLSSCSRNTEKYALVSLPRKEERGCFPR